MKSWCSEWLSVGIIACTAFSTCQDQVGLDACVAITIPKSSISIREIRPFCFERRHSFRYAAVLPVGFRRPILSVLQFWLKYLQTPEYRIMPVSAYIESNLKLFLIEMMEVTSHVIEETSYLRLRA